MDKKEYLKWAEVIQLIGGRYEQNPDWNKEEPMTNVDEFWNPESDAYQTWEEDYLNKTVARYVDDDKVIENAKSNYMDEYARWRDHEDWERMGKQRGHQHEKCDYCMDDSGWFTETQWKEEEEENMKSYEQWEQEVFEALFNPEVSVEDFDALLGGEPAEKSEWRSWNDENDRWSAVSKELADAAETEPESPEWLKAWYEFFDSQNLDDEPSEETRINMAKSKGVDISASAGKLVASSNNPDLSFTTPSTDDYDNGGIAELDKAPASDHYHGKVEPIQLIDAFDLNFSRGNAVKYIVRAGKKDNERQDLEKALWYIQHELDNLN
jgi:hypothetical protein